MRILVVEDEPNAAAYLRDGLAEHGFVVDVARQGDDGLHLALCRASICSNLRADSRRCESHSDGSTGRERDFVGIATRRGTSECRTRSCRRSTITLVRRTHACGVGIGWIRRPQSAADTGRSRSNGGASAAPRLSDTALDGPRRRTLRSWRRRLCDRAARHTSGCVHREDRPRRAIEHTGVAHSSRRIAC